MVAGVLAYVFLYKNDNPSIPSDEVLTKAIYQSIDPKQENSYKITNCKVLEAGFAKQTSYGCTVTTTFNKESRAPLTKDALFIKTKGGLIAEPF